MSSFKSAATLPPMQPAAQPKSETATRKLVVGRGIVFSGEITSCDCLVVEGTVKANIAGCHDINIAEGGLFTGSASVESAEIRGRFEGALNVTGRLLVHANGKVAAEVRYHQLEVERGGEISGQIEAQGTAQPAQIPTATPLPRRA